MSNVPDQNSGLARSHPVADTWAPRGGGTGDSPLAGSSGSDQPRRRVRRRTRRADRGAGPISAGPLTVEGPPPDGYQRFAMAILDLHHKTWLPWHAVPMCACGKPWLTCTYGALARRHGLGSVDEPAVPPTAN